ncbi:MAG TPA: HpsJ family protein, partial [Crinalium sp.]
MKTSNASPLTALILKSVGIVLIVLYLLDCAVVLSSSRFQDSQWLFTTTTQLIDRGFVPMMGFGFLFIGFWVESALEPTIAGERSRGLKLGVALLSSLLALLFLLFILLSVNATNAAADDQMKQITQDASRAESQIDGQVQQLSAQIDAQSGQIDQLIQ